MNHSHEPPLSSSQSLHDLIKSFLKAYDTRTEEEHEHQLHFFSEIPYFQRFINSPCQRKEFLQSVLKHVKYSYYPKGASIYETGEYGEFQIIISGEAFAYKPKKESELKAEPSNNNKKKFTKLYSKFLEENNYERLLKRSSHAYSRASLSKALISLAQGYTSNRPNLGIEHAGKKCEALGTIINEVLHHGNEIVSHENNEKDLGLEDKLLLLNSKQGNYVKDGQILYSKAKVLRDRDVLGNIALSLEVPFENPVIASEDTHVLTIQKKKFQSLLGKKIFKEKQEFMRWIFGDLDAESLFQLCIHSEERACSAKEMLYNYGDNADGCIYLVKSGKVQLVRSDKEKMKENYKNAESLGIALDLVRSPLKKFQMSSNTQITIVEQNGVFGGEGNQGMDHMAIIAAPLTFLYIIKQDVYLGIFEKHLPHISNALKNLLSKNNSIEITPKIKESTIPQTSTSPVKNILLTTTRLMGELEAQYRHLDSERPELIKETKLTPVLYQEDRGSRLIANKVEITVCDVGQKPHLTSHPSDHPSPLVPKPTLKLQNTSSSSIKRQRSVEGIQSVKSSLFLRNQANISRSVKRSKEENRSLRTSRCGGIVRAESNVIPVLEMMISPRSDFSRTQSLRNAVIDPKNPYEFSIKADHSLKLKMSIDAGADVYTLSGLQTDRSSTSRYGSIISPHRPLGTPHVRLTAEVPKTPSEQQRVLTAGGNQMLKRVTALMSKKKTGRETPVASMNSVGFSLAKLNSEDNLITPRSYLPRTATSYKTINSSENLELRTARSTSILGSLARLNVEEDTEVLRGQPSRTQVSSILIPSLGNLEGVGKAFQQLGSFENIEGEPSVADQDDGGGGLSSRRRKVLVKKKELGIKMMISPKKFGQGHPGYFTSRPKRMSEVLY